MILKKSLNSTAKLWIFYNVSELYMRLFLPEKSHYSKLKISYFQIEVTKNE